MRGGTAQPRRNADTHLFHAGDWASQWVWHEWMKAPFPGFLRVGPRFAILAWKSVSYLAMAWIWTAVQLSGLWEHACQPGTAPHTPFSVPFWLGKLGASSEV